MSKLFFLLVGIIVGGGAAYVGLNNHIVRTAEGYELVPKSEAGLTETYVDIRNFRLQDWAQHKTLAAALIRARKEHLMGAAAEQNLKDKVGAAVDSFLNR